LLDVAHVERGANDSAAALVEVGLRAGAAKGTAATTRNRKVVCRNCNLTGRFAFGQLMRVGMPVCGGCGERMEWGTVEDAARAGLVDARSLPARELRRLGWDDEIQRRSPGRKSKQRQCDNGCGRFVATSAERCAGGHWQQWALRLRLNEMPF
jgi:hypothetical protein